MNKIYNNQELAVVCDEVGSPTNSYDLGLFILNIIPLINSNQTEIYHFSNRGYCSRYELAKEILKISGKSMNILPIYSSSLKINRPEFSAFDLSKIKKEFAYEPTDWRNSLKVYLNKSSFYEI